MNMRIRLRGSLLIAFMFTQQLTAVLAQTSKDGAPAQRPSRYEELGLPEGGSSLYLPDEAYVRWPLPPGEERYAKVDGLALKKVTAEIVAISRKSRDDGNQYWGRIAGTPYDRMAQDWMLAQFKAIGLEDVHRQELDLPPQWMPKSWEASLTMGGKSMPLRTTFPIFGTVGTPEQGIEAQAVWVGMGTAADFQGRDVRGKTVLISSAPTPGGRNHSADWNGAMRRAQNSGAALAFVIMGFPGRSVSEPMAAANSLRTVPTMTVSHKEGMALREALEQGTEVCVRLKLDVSNVPGLKTANIWGTLPGMTDENILVMAHHDGFFDGAMDNASGMAMMLEIARFYAAIPKAQRHRTLVFLDTPDHHTLEAVGVNWVHNNMKDFFAKTALIVNCEHPSQTQTYLLGSGIMTSNTPSARRWYVGGSDALKKLVLDSLKTFGVAIYTRPERTPGGELSKLFTDAPSFHIIDHVFYHTDLDTLEMAPAWGMEAATRAFLKIIDGANRMSIKELIGTGLPARAGGTATD